MNDSLPFQQTEIGCRVEGAKWYQVRSDSAMAGVRVTRSRRRPWLHEARVMRFGRGLAREEVRDLVAALSELARERPVLRLRIEALSERPAELEAVAEACAEAGFLPASVRRSYARTAWIDLLPTEEELLSGFHKTARQNIRAPGKKGLLVQDIVDPTAGQRLRELMEESFRRTGGTAPNVSWEDLIEYAAQPAANVRVAGLFRPDASTHEPLSFAVAYLHGGVAEYAHAGSIRDNSLRVSLLYAVAWHLIRWAKARGAVSWDFGGVTETGGKDADDDRAGITDFKRYFSTNVIDVAEEWVIEPRRGAASLLKGIFNPWRGL